MSASPSVPKSGDVDKGKWISLPEAAGFQMSD